MSIYIRNARAVLEQLVIDNDQIVSKEDCYIHIPVRFTSKNLGSIGSDTSSFGIFPIILKNSNEYGVLSVNSIIKLNPFTTDIIVINEDEYYELYFEANTVIIENINVVRKDSLMFNILDEFIIKGKVPWYLSVEDLAKFLDTAKSHANSRVAQNPEIIELLTALISRDKNNLKEQIRHTAKDKNYIINNINYIPLASVMYAVSGTTNKLIGSYMDEGITSALVTETTKASNIEKLLRN